ncbi:hypothetical protein CEXT_814361 [Caerostris extrusa]|uniref:Uncharacterized protein n=1 Tax=Caerostris extrusa TaxID=172846 RepID=A0AAV4QX50_CAEEX|nr:hypothetical protein CEXT_814361 [Caerostris extrusa]
METAEDEWWRRMERAETIDYSVRASAPGASNPELMDTMSASITSELLASPIFQEKLSEKERCARISTVTKKKDIAQNLYDACAAALTGYSIDDDDLKELKIRHDDLQLAMREGSKLELCPLPSFKNIKLPTLTLKLSAMLPILTIMNMIMTVLLCPPKSLLLRSLMLKILNI